MTDFKASRRRLKKNLNILEERAARLANNVPLDLLTQIEDHQQAIALTDQAIAGELGEGEWQEAIQRLNVSLEPTRNVLQVFVQAVPVPYLAGIGVALFALLGLGVLSLGPVQGVLFPSPTATITPTFTPTATPTVTPSPTPEKLKGDFNLALAQFEVTGQGESLDEAEALANNFTNAIEREIESLRQSIELDVEIYPPQLSGIVTDETAEQLAEQIGAQVVIFGSIEVAGQAATISPKFYVHSNDEFEGAAEVAGQYRMGKAVQVDTLNASRRQQVSNTLADRFKALAFVVYGLADFTIGAYDSAEENFTSALKLEAWENTDVIYVWLGNVATRQDRYEVAADYFEQARAKNPRYARAYGGLAQAIFLEESNNYRVREDGSQSFEQINLERVDAAIDLLEQALGPGMEQPPLADVPVRVKYNLGRLYLLKAVAMEDKKAEDRDQIIQSFSKAFESFVSVIEAYEAENNPRLQEVAAFAHRQLGWIYHNFSDFDEAIFEYQLALGRLPQLDRTKLERASYQATLGDIYFEQGQISKALEWYELALENATADPKVVAQYQEKIKQLKE